MVSIITDVLNTRSPSLFGRSEDGYVVVYLGLLSLCDTLGDPDDVAVLLLLQSEIRVKYPEVELLHEGQNIHLHLRKTEDPELLKKTKLKL